MKLYIAGNGKCKGSSQRDHNVGARNRLLSYAFLNDWAKDEFVFWVDHHPENASVFLDSGAYSAHTLGRKIDLGEYCAYVARHQAALSAYAVLDIIRDHVGTHKNLIAMRHRGLDPVPIYQWGAPFKVLEELAAESPSRYVALGGLVSGASGRADLEAQLDRCWRTLERHWPVRVHGLGVMGQWALERYPWYSVDSASAIMAAGMGRVNRFVDRAWRTQGDIGEMVSNGWREDARTEGDGIVADGIGRVRKAGGKSDSAHEGRRIRNIEAQLALERYVTDLWAAKGVRWDG